MRETEKPVYAVLWSICACHLINDMLQSLLPASYPLLKAEFHLDFAQVGVVTLAYQLTASLLQPVVGLVADRRPMPFSLPAGTLFSFAGLLVISAASTFGGLLAGACVLGVGSSVFHPESSRVAKMASGGRPGLAQSLFQVGGNTGGALGPLAAAIVVLRWGRHGIGLFAGLALVSTIILANVGVWYRTRGIPLLARAPAAPAAASGLSRGRVMGAFAVLVVLVFSKFVYLASLTNYFTFYLIRRFGVSVQSAQLHLFLVLGAAALGTIAGGPIGDRLGRKRVIWISILGVLPFSLALPYANLFWTGVLSALAGFLLASAFPAIVVYGQELLPGRVGMVAGMLFGLSFGAAGTGAALMGRLADATSLEAVYRLVAFLPAIGFLAAFLPDMDPEPAPFRPAQPAPEPAGGPDPLPVRPPSC